MQSMVEIKPSINGEITLPFTDVGKSYKLIIFSMRRSRKFLSEGVRLWRGFFLGGGGGGGKDQNTTIRGPSSASCETPFKWIAGLQVMALH